ncbi:DEAD/DEAH box helicase family protein [Agriterribacter sp.]|uniref:TOTE conflict system archaeo-eukaryotic primase domain-containing protein n=1 Tax=Agriterribacter sp. TaxID=2821509 RepID=UPI002CEED54C|nr:DEAD/DEAH box helicase family protein [Agriterribacter sp.]HRO46483.1 DEAD/DEAH box helicase family protein [Agriterribacter sp.]HRQ17382.1 DEAD/DEAH box helicase family protein [Agriterribacter sp.]
MVQNIEIFKSLFKGRDNVFAIRWERDGKSGYMPAYILDWDQFKLHKAKGGTLKDFKDKAYAPLTDQRILNHLVGKEIVGIYPLLQDNTSWFIAADFDQSTAKTKSWIGECRTFILECKKHNLPVYLERSRSGAGGHVWMFFEEPYPAFKIRQLFIHLLKSSGIISEVDKNSNFDRLFPNQDAHAGKGLGNLIALPLQRKAMENGNACFIHPENLESFPDQWMFLEAIQKVKTKMLNELYETIIVNKLTSPTTGAVTTNALNGEFPITLSNQVVLPRHGLNPLLSKYLKDNLDFMNVDYLIKKRSGRSTYGTQMYFETVEKKENTIVMPRGIIGRLLRYCNEQKIPYKFEDKRVKLEPVKFTSSISLYNYQQEAVEAANKKDFGVIVAPPGAGKTVMGLEIVARKQQPALIIVHRRQLFDQWVDRIQSFLGIPKFRIGRIEGGKYEIGQEITVAMIQSLQTPGPSDKNKLYHAFGTIIVDECHHIPAKTFREVIQHFHSYYLYGFTATPVRKNKDEKLIFIHIGDIIHEVTIPITANQNKQLSVTIQNTELFTPFNASTDKIETLINILIHDTARNEMIVENIKREAKAGRKILVLTERKAHVDILQQYLKGICETITLTGEDNEQSQKAKLQLIHSGDFQVLIATGQFIGEGTDIGVLDCLTLAYPFSFEGKLIQYIGRVQRSPVAPVIYDYRDYRIGYFNNLFKQRNKYYRKLMKSGQLANPDEILLVFQGPEFYINTAGILLPVDCIDLPLPVETFKDGVAWKLRVISYNEEEGELFSEIIDYDFQISKVTDARQGSFYFYGIERIKFRSLDTSSFLRSVILKHQPVIGTKRIEYDRKEQTPTEYVILKTMKVLFGKINFLFGSVSFPIFIEEVNQEIIFEIANPDIRPEFAAVRDYFIKALKKKLFSVNITVNYTASQILSATAISEDIDSINNQMIDSVRFEFVKREIFKGKGRTADDQSIHTMDDLLSSYDEGKKLFSSEAALVDDILSIKNSKHYLQLKYLSSKHEASVLKLRFVLQPFSFLFLLAGEKKYHIIWETLDSEEATYIWHTDKTRESLRIALEEIEAILRDIKQNGRQTFLEKESSNFSRVVHDYVDAKKGFVTWKGVLEEKLV